MPRLLLGVAALVAALVASLPTTVAQQEEACRRPVVLAADGPAAWEPGSRFPIQIAIENPNEAPVETVTVRAEASAPPGWSALLAWSSLTIGPGNHPLNTLTVTASQRGSGLDAGEIVVTVRFTCHHPGDLQANAQASLVLPVALAPARVPWLLVGGIALAAIAVAGGLYAWRARLPRVGIKAVHAERALPPGKGGQFPLVVANRRREPDGVILAVTDVPAGWSAHLAVDEIDLEPREERSLWVMVRPPPNARPGDAAALTVRATSRKNPREVAYAEVRARVQPTGP